MKKRTTPGTKNSNVASGGLSASKHSVPLSKFDWDFANVETWECAACCHYEYARESPSIVAHYDHAKTLKGSPTQLLYRATVGGRFVTLPNPFQWAWRVHSLMKFATTPWQTLPEKYRRMVSAEYTCDDRYHTAICHADSQFVPTRFLSRGNDRNGIDPETGIERVALEIDWAGFDNAEIVNAFKQWVEDNRPSKTNLREWHMWMPKKFPKNIGKANSQGHDKMKYYQKSLARLGIFRLRKRHTLEEMQSILSGECITVTAEKRRWQNKLSVISECNREFRKAIQDFHDLFPFLPRNEIPFTLKPKRTPRVLPTQIDQPYMSEYRVSGLNLD